MNMIRISINTLYVQYGIYNRTIVNRLVSKFIRAYLGAYNSKFCICERNCDTPIDVVVFNLDLAPSHY